MKITEALKEIGKHGLIYMIAFAFNSALRIVLLPVYTRYLHTSEYGILALLDSSMDVIRILCAMGLGLAITRIVNDYQDIEHRHKVIGTALMFLLIVSGFAAVLFYPFSGYLSRIILGTSVRPLYFQLALATTLLGLFQSGIDTYFTTNKRSTAFILISMCRMLFNAAINVTLLVVYKMGVLAMLLGALITAIVFSCSLFIYVAKRTGLCFDLGIMTRILRYGLPLVPALLSSAGMHNVDRFFIRLFSNLQEVGIYSLAYQFPFLLNAMFLLAFMRIWFASTMFSIAREPDAPYLFGRICTYYISIITFALFSMSVTAATLIKVMASQTYFAAHNYVPVIALGVWGYALHTFVRIGVDLSKRTYLFAISHVLALVVNVLLNFAFVPRWGAMGAAWVTVITYFTLSIGGFLIYRGCYPLALEWTRLAKLLLLALFLFVIRQMIPTTHFFAAILVETLIILSFPVILLASDFLTLGEKMYLKNMLFFKISPRFQKKIQL